MLFFRSFLPSLFFLFFFSSLVGENLREVEPGVLIVSYSSPSGAISLDQVRFWITNERDEQILYPKQCDWSFLETNNEEKAVMIPSLTPGEYEIEFVYPNRDNTLVQLPKQAFRMTSGGRVEIHEIIAKKEETENARNHEVLLINENDRVAVRYPPYSSDVRGDAIIIRNYGYYPYYPYYPGYDYRTDQYYPYSQVLFSVNSNRNTATWELFQNGELVTSGMGSAKDVGVFAGDNYLFVPEEIPGYSAEVTPSGLFRMSETGRTTIVVTYRRDVGFVQLRTPFPPGETMGIIIESSEGRTPVNISLRSQDGMIEWRSPALPTGNYQVIYSLPRDMYFPIPPEKITVNKGGTVYLSPQFAQKQSVRVKTNTERAIFTLQGETRPFRETGRGKSHTFGSVPPGTYRLRFTSEDPKVFVPPPDRKILVTENFGPVVDVVYEKMGQLIIQGNVSPFSVTIEQEGGEGRVIEETVRDQSATFFLPEGRYTISFAPLTTTRGEMRHPPEPMEVTIQAFSPQTLYARYRQGGTIPGAERSSAVPQQTKEIEGDLVVENTIENAPFRIVSLEDPSQEWSYQGRHVEISLPAPASYEIHFEDTNFYRAPPATKVTLQPNERKIVQGRYVQESSFLDIPEGIAIVGDPFEQDMNNVRPPTTVFLSPYSIGKYEVTNHQYAKWLTQAFGKGMAAFAEGVPGEVVDKEGHLLFRTFDADPLSQIIAFRTQDGYRFNPVPGKDEYPVIHVTWYGANLFAEDQGWRLPTEAEWEKAAGMALKRPGDEWVKYRYGFGQNTINRQWANYRYNETASPKNQVLSTPVGFFNGKTMLPIVPADPQAIRTEDARSPAGAYDMSGNVWEWVRDWYDPARNTPSEEVDPQGPASGTKKLVKGGCYDSFANGVRVAERLPLAPEHSDIYTGFRVVQK